MTETPEVMRQHIEETKSQLWEKLDTLESQVSEAVQSTSTAVSETVASVQETVSNVTESVQDSVHTVSNAIDLPRQIERHPWIAFGGSFVLGYLASELLNPPQNKSECEPCAEPRSSSSAAPSENGGGQHKAGQPTSSASSSRSWAEMRGMLTGALMGSVSTMVSRGVPTVLDYLAKSFRTDPVPNEDSLGGGERRRSPK